MKDRTIEEHAKRREERRKRRKRKTHVRDDWNGGSQRYSPDEKREHKAMIRYANTLPDGWVFHSKKGERRRAKEARQMRRRQRGMGK